MPRKRVYKSIIKSVLPAYQLLEQIYKNDLSYTKEEDVEHIGRVMKSFMIMKSAVTGKKIQEKNKEEK